MNKSSELPEFRASDTDRERVADVLRDALAEGRLDIGEFEERLAVAYKARTYGELEPLTRDLPTSDAMALMVPGSAEIAPRRSWAARIGGRATSRKAVAVIGGFERRGRWIAPRCFRAFAFMGGGEIDLREARFEDKEIEIRCYALMGGFNVIVPPGVETEVRGVGIMGGFDHRASGEGEPGAPRVVVTGVAVMGGVSTQRKLPEAEQRRLKAAQKKDQEMGQD
jgi:hypothetical protein